MSAIFGPAGNAESFPYKSSADAPRWLAELGLDCYEYQCGKGVNVREETARNIGAAAVAAGMFFGCIFAVADDSPLGALVLLAMGIYAAYKAGRIRPSPALRDYAAGKGGDRENPFTWERNR